SEIHSLSHAEFSFTQKHGERLLELLPTPTPTPVLKSQVEWLVASLGFAVGTLAFLALCWECRPRGQTGQHIWHQRIRKSFAAILAVENPGGHWFKSPDLNQAVVSVNA
ncbi:MAG: hypothetical protein WA785_10730, partial [Candidatus Acidiferrales bacterium]